jgi:hypothetical protein
MAKTKKVQKGVKEIFDLEVDEVSAVDMAAIGESFYITKSVNKNNKKGAKVAKVKKLPLIKAMPKWSEKIAKADSDKCGEHCHFCGITKEVEAETMGAGLRNSVCIGCALEHFEKGVFDQCCTFSFDIEKFKESYPDVKLHEVTKADEDSEDEDESEEEADDEGKDKDKKDDEDSEDEDESEEGDEEDADDEDSEDEDESGKNKAAGTATSEEDESEDDSELDNDELSKRVVKLEKNLEDVSGMLERSLELHDFAAGALNEVVSLTFASIDMLMAMMAERKEEGDSEKAKEQESIFTSINDSIKSVRQDVEKAGAKISGKRMAVLREIAGKLSELIESVLNNDSRKGVTKSAMTELQKSLDSFKEEIKEELKTSSSSFKEDIDSKLEKINTKLEDIEQSGGASFNLGDDDEEESDADDEVEKGESVFSNLVGLSDISKNIQRKQRNLKRK